MKPAAEGDEPQRYSPDGDGGMQFDSLGGWVRYKPQPKGTDEPWPGYHNDIAMAIGELSAAMGSPTVMARRPASLLSATVRAAANVIAAAQAPAPGAAHELADKLCWWVNNTSGHPDELMTKAAAELRRLAAVEAATQAPAPAPEPAPEPVAFEAREIGESDWTRVGLDEIARIASIIASPTMDYRVLYDGPVPDTQTHAPARGRWVNADDIDALTKRLDEILNGPRAAEAPSLCDIVSQLESDRVEVIDRRDLFDLVRGAYFEAGNADDADTAEVHAQAYQYAERTLGKLYAEGFVQSPAVGAAEPATREVCGRSYVEVRTEAVDWLKKHYPALCEKSGLCERIGGRLYTRSVTPAPKAAPLPLERPLTGCAAGKDGDCTHSQCPQLRDGEPSKTGRHCPLDSDVPVQKTGGE